MLQRLIHYLLPAEKTFFSYLDRIAANLLAGAQAFGALATALSHRDFEELARPVKLAESEGDDLARAMHDALDKTFVTPIDREDLHALTAALEMTLDTMEGSAARFALYGFEQPTEPMKRLIGLIVEAVTNIAKAVELLKDMRRLDEIELHVAHVRRLEHEADQVYRGSLAELFGKPPDAVDLVRRKDLLQCLENGMDQCNHTMTVIRALVLKNL